MRSTVVIGGGSTEPLTSGGCWGASPSTHPNTLDVSSLLRCSLPPRLIAISLFLFQLFFNLILLVFANESIPLTREEAHSSFVNVVYFENRLQASEYATNPASYLWFSLAHKLTPFADPFYGRTLKALIFASIAPLIFIMLRREGQPLPVATAAGAFVALMPGVFAYATVGVDMGIELPLGLLAMLAAHRGYDAVAGFAMALAALSYGSALAFVLPLALLLRTPARLLRAFLAGLIPFAIAILWISNVQILLLGGGNRGVSPWLCFKILVHDALQGYGSYYYTLHGHPALTRLSLLVTSGFVFAAIRWREHGHWLLLAACSFLIATFSGFPPGIRRAIPFTAAAGICFMLLVGELYRRSRLQYSLAIAAITAVCLYDAALVPRDMHRHAPRDLNLAIPSRSSLSVQFLLGEPGVTFDHIQKVEDLDDPPFNAKAPRFSETRRLLEKRFSTTSSAR